MVILKGSAKKAKSTFKDPIGTHEKAVKIWRRSSVLFESNSKNTPTLTAKDPPTMSVANKTPNYPRGFSPKTNSVISFTENKG